MSAGEWEKDDDGFRKPNLEDRIDRYARGELTPAEARELAQASLDSPELFEELTWSAVAKTALPAAATSPARFVVPHFPPQGLVPRSRRGSRSSVDLVLYGKAWPRNGNPRNLPGQARASVVRTPRTATVAGHWSGPDASRPHRLSLAVPESRAPQQKGLILSIEDGMATIGLGSLDNLAKGSELQIFRDERVHAAHRTNGGDHGLPRKGAWVKFSTGLQIPIRQ